jgi:hypothetical protein
MAGMSLEIGTHPDSVHYTITDANGTVVKNFHTNDREFAERTIERLNESYELLGGVTVTREPAK